MVAIKTAGVAKAITAPSPDHQAFLIYGPDSGLVSERGKALASVLAAAGGSAETADILRLDEEDLSADPDRLAVELRTVSMFGDAKVVRLRFGPRVNPDVLGDFLDGAPIEGRLIVEAGDLKKTAKLRKLFEASKHAAALPCYPDTQRGLDALIDEVLGAANLAIAADAKGVLVAMLGADRALSRNEVEKLALYAEGQERVSIEDVRAVVGDASEMALDRIIRAAFAGQPDAAIREYDRATAAGQQPQSVLLALQRHVLRLFRYVAARDAGRSADTAMRLMRPPLFGADRDAFLRQANTWSMPRLDALREAVAKAVRLGRTDATLEDAEAARLLLSIGQAAARR
ncbi:MAG: DNA polymerase III subunit delta [Pseudomonadota bacterium]